MCGSVANFGPTTIGGIGRLEFAHYSLWSTKTLQQSPSNQTDAAEAGAELDAWLVEADGCGVPTMATFAAGLRRDGDAIRTALTMPWSNGQTEGQVNRLKLVKRQMYGHASFNLLRRRVLLAA